MFLCRVIGTHCTWSNVISDASKWDDCVWNTRTIPILFVGTIVHCTVGYKVVMWSDSNPGLWFPCQGNLRLQEMMGVMCKERGAKLFATDERWAKLFHLHLQWRHSDTFDLAEVSSTPGKILYSSTSLVCVLRQRQRSLFDWGHLWPEPRLTFERAVVPWRTLADFFAFL